MVNGTSEYPAELPENPTSKDQQDYYEAIAAWEALSLDGLKHYGLDVGEAIRLLESGRLNDEDTKALYGMLNERYNELKGREITSCSLADIRALKAFEAFINRNN